MAETFKQLCTVCGVSNCGVWNFFFFDYEKTKTMCPESHSVIEYNIHENVSIHEMAFTYEKYISAYILLINDR